MTNLRVFNSDAMDIVLSRSLQDFRDNKTYLFDPNINLADILNFAANIKKNYCSIIIIGFGASSLNAKALLSCLKKTKIDIFFIDNIDETAINSTWSKIDATKTAIFAISLSGETDEVICLIKHLKPEPNNLFISARSNSSLHHMANVLGANYIQYPAQYNVGRFALFSPIFLTIAAIAELDIKILFEAARQALNDPNIHYQAVIDSTWMLDNYNNHKPNIIIISYATKLQGLLQWLNQMISESLGKNGFGLMPCIEWGSRCEHSMLQLFLDGPDDKMYKIFLNNLSDNNALDNLLKNHGQNVLRELNKLNKPTKAYTIELINETLIAKLIIKYIIIIDLIGRIQKINPFNQPAVENLKLSIKS
jgi:glucose-6-phosphate isomerase